MSSSVATSDDVGSPPTPTTTTTNSSSANNLSAMKKMSKIVNYFLGRPEATPFLEPVDWRLLELYDYLQVIETPMDLGTIRRKLDRSLTALNKESTSSST